MEREVVAMVMDAVAKEATCHLRTDHSELAPGSRAGRESAVNAPFLIELEAIRPCRSLPASRRLRLTKKLIVILMGAKLPGITPWA